MPSRSAKQARFMAMIAHSPAAAKRTGVPQSVAAEFNAADSESGMLSRAMRKRPSTRKGRNFRKKVGRWRKQRR